MSKMMSIYIHIPFCIRKCGYCDFLSFPVQQYGNRRTSAFESACADDVPEEYLQRLLWEIHQASGDYADREVDTIFIGGGTPSLLLPGQAVALFDMVYQSFHVDSAAEITMEANPGTLTKEKLEAYRQMGVNRLSIGLQSADDGELAVLGRIHRLDDFKKSFELARNCGFQNINIDLMSGLPGQNVGSWIHTLHTAVDFGAEHISAYGLIIEEGTPFYQRYGIDGAADRGGRRSAGEDRRKETGKSDKVQLPSEDEDRQMYHKTGDILERYGYRQYEISNYAKCGYECRHNIGYWIRKEYVGFGLGAASMVNNERWKNTSDLKKYMKNADSGDETAKKDEIGESASLLKEEVQALTVQEQMEETMFLGLRMNQGVSKKEFETQYGIGIEQLYGTWLHRMSAEGLLIDGERVYLSERGRDLSNYVMTGFLMD